MCERATTGYQVNFADYCPLLQKNNLNNSPQLFFTPDTSIASETGCPYGGIAGVEQRSESGMLVKVNPDKIVVSCIGCTKLPAGFEELLKDA